MNITNFIERETFLVISILVLLALAAFLAKKAGIINIALEGQAVGACLGYSIVSFWIKKTNLNVYEDFLLSCLGAIALTFVVTIIFAFIVIHMKSNQIITGLAFNIILIGIATFTITYLNNKPELTSNIDYLKAYTSNNKIFLNLHYWQLSEMVVIHYMIFLTLLLAMITYFVVFKTRTGLHLRACGENSKITTMHGISVKKQQYFALILGTIFISLAGIAFLEWVNGFNGTVYGYGYFGLLFLMLGKNRIMGIIFFSIIFTIGQTFAFTTFGNKDRDLIMMVNYTIPLLILIIYGLTRKWKQKSQQSAL